MPTRTFSNGSFQSGFSRKQGLRIAFVTALILFGLPLRADEEQVQVWEYAPYRVQVWYDFEPSIVESDQAKAWFLESLHRDLQRAFRATWELQLAPIPHNLSKNLERGFDSASIPDLTRSELAMVVSTAHPEARSLRTFQASCETLDSIAASLATRNTLQSSLPRYDLVDDKSSGRLLERLSDKFNSDSQILQALTEASIPAALVPKTLVKNRDGMRVLTTPLPWQTDWFLSNLDKLFFVVIGMEGDQYRLRVRELDCPMQFFSISRHAVCSTWSETGRLASYLIAKSFSPVARVESAEATTAQLRGRAAGLITDDDLHNPARLRLGDVMQPIIRRDDRSGVPVLLQPLNFTFAAITETNGVTMRANVYTYSGGPGLRGRQNPRTHRVLLRVRPQRHKNELQVVVRGSDQQPQSGCAVYLKDHLTDEFTYLGRTDWRGKMPLPIPESPVNVLPSEIKSQRDSAKRTARETALAQARQSHDEMVNRAKAEGKDSPKFDPPVEEDVQQPIDPTVLVRLSAPLIQLYVKSGDTVLARLPIVPGLKPLEVAELPNDQLRLQSEALVRGFQGEILDLVGQRNLLAARVRLNVQKNNLQRADQDMQQLRNLKDFNQMNDELSRIQRTILEQTDSSISRSVQTQIDRMFKTTRDLLQKYMQQDIVAETAGILRAAQP